MSPEHVDDLLTRYPVLFACNPDWAARGVSHHYPITCGDGWFGLVNAACQALQELTMRTFETTHHKLLWMPRASIYTDPTDHSDQGGLLRIDLLDRDNPPMPEASGHSITPADRINLVSWGISWMATDASSVICEVCGDAGRLINFRVRCADHLNVIDVDDSAFARRATDQLLLDCRPTSDKKLFVRVHHPIKRSRRS